MAALPVDIDQLFIDFYYYFKHSSKRNEQFVDMWHFFYNNEPKVLLKHCQTGWLCLIQCIRRYLDLFDGVLSYFHSCDDQTAKVVSINERLENPLTKPILHSLNHVLPSMDKFNRSFQKSNENTCELYMDIVRLTKIYVVNFLTEEAVHKAGDKIHLVDMDKMNLHENLSVGDETWLCIREEMDTKSCLCVKAFYSATLQRSFKKFPFGDTILQDLGTVRPTKTKS